MNEPLGVLVLSMTVNVPSLKGRHKAKQVTLARFYGVSEVEAREMKARFCFANDEIVPDYINGKWQYTSFV